MAKKTNEEFRKDILDITKAQDARIASFEGLIKDQAEHTEVILKEILGKLNEPQIPTIPDNKVMGESSLVACYSTFTETLTQEETTRRAGEIAKLIKPIMEQYGLSQVQAVMTKKK